MTWNYGKYGGINKASSQLHYNLHINTYMEVDLRTGMWHCGEMEFFHNAFKEFLRALSVKEALNCFCSLLDGTSEEVGLGLFDQLVLIIPYMSFLLSSKKRLRKDVSTR